MPAKRKAVKKEDKDLQRAAQRAWMLDQKRNMDEVEEEAEAILEPVVEDKKEDDIKDSEADSGVEDNNVEEAEEEDGPLEEWTLKELKEECKTLGLADKGKKAELIERIKESRVAAASTSEPIEEDSVPEVADEEAPVEEIVEEPEAEEEAPVAAEEAAPEAMEVEEEDAPLEEWSVKELKEECKTLGVSDKGKKSRTY